MIGAAIKKDVWLLLRDRGALISLFLLPIIFIVAFGAMFGPRAGSGKPRPIAIWHQPGDARGQAVATTLAQAAGFAAAPAGTADEVRDQVASERVIAGLVVPPGTGPIELVIDLASPLQVRGPIQGALSAVVMRAMSPSPTGSHEPLVEAKSPPGLALPPENVSSFQITVPGNAVLFGFFMALTVAMAFVGERRTGTWRRLLAAPVPRWKALVATLVPYFLVGVVQLAFLFGIGAGVFGMQVAGSVGALVALSLALALCAVCLGLLFAAVARTEKQLGAIGSVTLLVMGLLGGCMFPRLLMPDAMKRLGLGVPHGWALDGYHDVLVRSGTSIADVAPSIAALLAFAAGFALLGLALFKFES
ncbi:MAG: ABC transporter permease [Kofleriaceae bacterium]